jgi:hypothetical protein
MPEYQAVIGKRDWYIETEATMEWRILKRRLDEARHGKILYSRRALPQYQGAFPDITRPIDTEQGPNEEGRMLKDPGAPVIYHLITTPEVISFSLELKRLDAKMGKTKTLDDNKTLALNDGSTVKNIGDEITQVIRRYDALKALFPDLTNTILEEDWNEFIENRIHPKYKRLVEREDRRRGIRLGRNEQHVRENRREEEMET